MESAYRCIAVRTPQRYDNTLVTKVLRCKLLSEGLQYTTKIKPQLRVY